MLTLRSSSVSQEVMNETILMKIYGPMED